MGDVLKVKFGPGEEEARPPLSSAEGLLRFGDALIDLPAREIRVGGRLTRIEPRAAAVLADLIGRAGAVVQREALLDGCWPPGEGSDEALTQAVAQLRRALGDDPKAPDYIVTVPKAGYRWVAQEEPVAGTAPPPPPVYRRPWAIAAAAVAGLALVGAGAVLGLRLASPPERRIETASEVVLVYRGDPRDKALPSLPSLPRTGSGGSRGR
jgi:transcriptional activator of cad operon